MTSSCLPNHPIALLKNNVVEAVVLSGTHDKKEIEDILNRFSYDEAVSSCEQGYEIYVGCEKFKDKIREPAPYKSWLYKYDLNIWVPPIDYPKDASNLWEYYWDEDSNSWAHCNCFKVE